MITAQLSDGDDDLLLLLLMASWSILTELAVHVTSALQRQWNEERANRVATNVADSQPEDSTSRQAWLNTRNQRQNEAQRRARSLAPPQSPPALAILARRVIVRERVRRHRARVRLSGRKQREQQEQATALLPN
uniref:Uncharacterized protein n=1 Tax=Anopheles culicifacies TaxID=139723 RepID=A0A182MGF4_9DIPT